MRVTLTCLFAALLVAGTFPVHAQNADQGAFRARTRTHHAARTQRQRGPGENAATQNPGQNAATTNSSDTSDEGFPQPHLPRGTAGGPLPNYFPNCNEPIRPRFCPL